MKPADPATTEAWEITPAEAKRLIETDPEVRLIDCRTPREFEFARIEGATLVPLGDLAERIGELEAQADKKLVIYCHHGMRSLRMTAALRRYGLSEVLSMAGGIDRWSVDIDSGVPRY